MSKYTNLPWTHEPLVDTRTWNGHANLAGCTRRGRLPPACLDYAREHDLHERSKVFFWSACSTCMQSTTSGSSRRRLHSQIGLLEVL